MATLGVTSEIYISLDSKSSSKRGYCVRVCAYVFVHS